MRTDWRPAPPFLNCPRCGLSISPLRSRSPANAHCPRCLGRNGTIVELFSSRLPAGALYADNSLPRAGREPESGPRSHLLALDGRTVGGYVSLTTGSIRREAAPKRNARGMPRHPIPIILIARLAVDRRHQGNRLGSRLLAEALRLAMTASDTVAARLVVVDAIDEQAAGFYRRWGFIEVPENPHRLFRKISEIRRSLAGR